MKNMNEPQKSGSSMLKNWKVSAVVGLACITGLVAVVGYGLGPTGSLSKFSQTKVTAKTAATLWSPDVTSEHRKRLPQDFAGRVDNIVVAILRKGSNLQNAAFNTYLTNLSSGIRALGAKPAYANNEEVGAIINYLATEISATATSLDATGEFVEETERLVSGHGEVILNPICPVYQLAAPPAFCSYSSIKNPETGCDEPQLVCEDTNPKDEPLCTQEYAPVCGQIDFATCPKGMTCVTGGPMEKTFSNICEAGKAKATILHKGECGIPNPPAPPICPVADIPMLTSAQESRGCRYVDKVDSNGCSMPTLTCSCPAFDLLPLTDDQISAGCNYEWNKDEFGCNAPKLVCKSTACTKEYAPVCGLKPYTCNGNSEMACIALAATSQTYSNKCLALADGAQIISSGVCGTIAPKCPSKPEVTKEEASRGCTYETVPTFAKTDCPMYALKCKVANPTCPQFMPALISPEDAAKGCKYVSTTSENGCPGIKLECPVVGDPPICPQVMPALITDNEKALGCKYVSVTNNNGCPDFKLECPVVGDPPIVTGCTREYNPVCGQPPMPVCPEGLACTQAMPAPTTYGNVCMAKTAQATILYNGECGQGGARQ